MNGRTERDFEKGVDPKNKYYNNISTSLKYYAEKHFNNDLNVSYDGGLSLLHFNARSLRTSFSEIKYLLQSLKVNFDIAITETLLSRDSTTLYTFDDYDAFHVVRDNGKVVVRSFMLTRS